MTSAKRVMMQAVAGLVLIILGLLMIRTGTYGLTLFIVLPIAVGVFGAWVSKPKSAGKAAVAGMVANLIASLSFLAAGFEGLICIAMALPLALPLGALVGWLSTVRPASALWQLERQSWRFCRSASERLDST
jgi:hypothetical protein